MIKNPLLVAVQQEKVEELRRLLRAGANPNERAEDGTTPLMISAASAALTPCVGELLAAGADPEARDEAGWSPVFHAAGGLSLQSLQVIIAAGASVECRDLMGRTPMDVLIEKVNEEIDYLNGPAGRDTSRQINERAYNAAVRMLRAAGAAVTPQHLADAPTWMCMAVRD